MVTRRCSLCAILSVLFFLSACGEADEDTSTFPAATQENEPEAASPFSVSLSPVTGSEDLRMLEGGDVDSVLQQTSGIDVYRTGNGDALSSPDANTVQDYYLAFDVDDDIFFAGEPASRVTILIEYLDIGTDSFILQFDGISGGENGAGLFKPTRAEIKTGTGELRTATFTICDPSFRNRNNDADFRLADNGDGPEYIHRVEVIFTPQPSGSLIFNVDDFGANPFDSLPDSEAIQAGIDQMCSGDEIHFTSAGGNPDYQGYVIDKTIFLVRTAAKNSLTFTSTDPADQALLIADSDLLGFVVKLYARSQVSNPAEIDDITIENLHLDGNRASRICFGADEVGNGVGDNWGSWLPECDVPGDPWCNPGTLSIDGAEDFSDPFQLYEDHPNRWSTGMIIRNMILTNTECGTSLGYAGAGGVIDSVVSDTSGDHVHVTGCAVTDPDEPLTAWSDGITFEGPGNLVTNNTIINPSDIGIVTFGGRDTVISNNTIIAEEGNYGMFAGIAVHPYGFGWLPGVQVIGNTVTSFADETCGGIHAGIDLGAHMWGGGCVGHGDTSQIGLSGPCDAYTSPPGLSFCQRGEPCRVWVYIPQNETFTLADNVVTGAQINYLIVGLDVQGELILSNNVSNAPRPSDWHDDQYCSWGGNTASWGAFDFVAHDPALPGWVDLRVYCER